MTEQEFEFGISVFIQGKHVITLRGIKNGKWAAMADAYRLGAGAVEDISEIIAMRDMPHKEDETIAGFCIRNLIEYRKQMNKASWYHRQGFHMRYIWFY